MKDSINVEVVGFVIHADGMFEFANPCSIHLETLENAIKQHKLKRPKKNEITVVGLIRIPFLNEITRGEGK